MRQANSSKQRERAFREQGSKPAADTVAAYTATDPTSGNATGGEAVGGTISRAQRWRFVREYLRWLAPYRTGLVVVFLLALIAAALDMVWPLAIKRVIDLLPQTIAHDQKVRQLNFLGIAIVTLLLLKQGIDSFRAYRTAVLNAKVIFRLRRRLFDQLLRLSFGELGEMKSGGIVSRLSGDVDSVSGLVQMAIISPGVAIIRVIMTIIILFALSWQLAVVALIATPPMALASYLWLKKVRPIYRSMREDRTTIDARVAETFGGIRVVRAFRREKREGKSYAVGHHTVIRKNLLAERLELILAGAWGLLIPATSLLIVWYGGHLYLSGAATTGDIFAFQIFAVLLLQPVWQIVSSVGQTQRALAAMERIFTVLAMTRDKPDAPGAIDAPSVVRDVRFDHVSFEYRPGVPVLRDVDFTVPGGATVALVGPSGAGKTTLTDLVARFHDPTHGQVTLNGIDLRRLKLQSYRGLLAVVQQEVFLFDGSVRDNIAYGRRNVTDAQVEDAARRANAHEFIERLPEKYDTLIGERGFKLSGGQRQRLSIARAILADPQILILDEATSNLDTESEQLIQASLAELLRNRTTFVIAHRLSTVTHADLIVVLDEGRVIEMGTHDDLMARQGSYHEMVQRQWRAFATSPQLDNGAVTT
jgi:ATP-binding cassette, subfamily B, bacterial